MSTLDARKSVRDSSKSVIIMSTDSPDEYSNAWYRQQFRGYEHQLTRMNSDWIDLWDAVRDLRKQVNSLLSSREEDKAEIGRLHASLEKARDAFLKLKGADNDKQ